jgi:hypothetical protein
MRVPLGDLAKQYESIGSEIDAAGTPRRTYRGITIHDVCASRDGKYVATWSHAGLFRRWPVPA